MTISVLKNKWVQKFIDLFRQGLTPKELSLSITSAALIGVIPVLGVSTALIAFSALKFRLNLALMVAVSYIVYPFQFALFVPYLRFGEWLFNVEGSGLTIDSMKAAFSTNILEALGDLWVANLCALFSWVVISIPAGFAMYWVLFQVFKLFIKPKPVVAEEEVGLS